MASLSEPEYPPLRERLGRWYAAGRSQGIPPCCSARFAVDAEVVLPRIQSSVLDRVRFLLPRHALAVRWQAGVVPCEGHLLLWLLTGRRPSCARMKLDD